MSNGGVDVVLDHRLNDYLQFDANVASDGARVIGIGENASSTSFTHMSEVRSKDVSYQFMQMMNMPNLRDPLRRIVYLLDESQLSIQLARTYDLEETAEARRAVLEDSFLEKLVIEP